jgi:hypothetical protein
MSDLTTENATKQQEDVAQRKAKKAAGGTAGPSIFDLQGSAGNAAVVSLLADSPVQLKGLQVGSVYDPAEAEADRIADQVLRNLQTDEVARKEKGGRIRRFMPAGQILQATLEEEEKESEGGESGGDHDTDGPANEHEEEEKESEGESGGSETDVAPAPNPSGGSTEEAKHDDTGGESAESEHEEEEKSSDGGASAPSPSPSPSAPSAESEGGESESDEKIDRKVVATIRRSAADASGSAGHGIEGGAVDTDVAKRIDSARGGGRAMAPDQLSRMESGFGADFSGIRIHEGSQAQELNRSLNAQAFTTGPDIFVGKGGMDDRVLAHELAHTVQQGAAVRRFMGVAEFEALTYESRTAMKSTAQKEIIKMLTAYKALTQPGPKKGDKPVVPTEKLNNAIALVQNMRSASQAYMSAKKESKDQKARRLAGFRSFEIDCTLELEQLEKRRQDALASKTAPSLEPVTVDSKGLEKLQQHYSGTLSGSMTKAAMAVEQLAGENGASGEFQLDVDVPVSPGVTVGAHFKFEAKRGGKPNDPKPGNVEVGCELGFKVGGDALFAKIQAGIGGYFKATGKDAQSAMKLVSYGLYRRCRESSVIPSGVGNKLWGGDSGEKGKKKAEEWSLNVEKEEFTDAESSVETGAYASLNVKGGVEGVAEGEGEVKAATGKKYDRESLENSAKGGVGKENTTGDNWFAQKSTGRSVSSVELSAKAALLDAFGAEFKLNFQWEASGKKGEPSTLRGIELQFRGHGSMPSGAFADKLSALVIDFCTKAKALQKGQLQKASTLSQVGAGVTMAAGIADTTVTGVEDAPTAEVVKKLLGLAKEGAKEGGKEAGKSLVDSASKVGLELAYTFKYEDGACWSQFEILHRKALDAKIPGLLSAELIRRKRLLVGSNQTGTWGWELLA